MALIFWHGVDLLVAHKNLSDLFLLQYLPLRHCNQSFSWCDQTGDGLFYDDGDGDGQGGEVHEVAPGASGQLRSSPPTSTTKPGGIGENER